MCWKISPVRFPYDSSLKRVWDWLVNRNRFCDTWSVESEYKQSYYRMVMGSLVTELLPPLMWRWWHLVHVFIITIFYFVNWNVAHNCLLRLIRTAMESKWLHFFLLGWGSRVWQPTMTVFIVQTRTSLITVNWNTKQLFRHTQHFDTIPHSATCFLSSGQVCYKRLRNISPYAIRSFFVSDN